MKAENPLGLDKFTTTDERGLARILRFKLSLLLDEWGARSPKWVRKRLENIHEIAGKLYDGLEPPTEAGCRRCGHDPNAKREPIDVSDWTAEEWADALEAARDDMMTLEDWEPADIAHVMTAAATKLRTPTESREGEERDG